MRSAAHRKGLVKYAEAKGLFRDPERLVERMAQLEDGLWRAVGIAEIDIGVMVGPSNPHPPLLTPRFRFSCLDLHGFV